jgi:nitrogen fixation NifU-like protein
MVQPHVTISPVYSAQVLNHFQNPRNAGDLADANASVQIENPACGDILKLSARIEHGRIAEIRFLAKGCVSAMACASLLTELASGKSLLEAKQIEREDLVKTIGGLPEASSHAGYLAIDALRSLLEQVKT